jgi:hypothetical protein
MSLFALEKAPVFAIFRGFSPRLVRGLIDSRGRRAYAATQCPSGEKVTFVNTGRIIEGAGNSKISATREDFRRL